MALESPFGSLATIVGRNAPSSASISDRVGTPAASRPLPVLAVLLEPLAETANVKGFTRYCETPRLVLAGDVPFDETTLSGSDHDGMSQAPDAVGVQGLEAAAVAEAEAKERRARERTVLLSR